MTGDDSEEANMRIPFYRPTVLIFIGATVRVGHTGNLMRKKLRHNAEHLSVTHKCALFALIQRHKCLLRCGCARCFIWRGEIRALFLPLSVFQWYSARTRAFGEVGQGFPIVVLRVLPPENRDMRDQCSLRT